MTSDETDQVSCAAAAALLQTTELRVLMLLKQGVLRGSEIDGAWQIERASLAAAAAAPRPSAAGCGSHSGGCSGCGSH